MQARKQTCPRVLVLERLFVGYVLSVGDGRTMTARVLPSLDAACVIADDMLRPELARDPGHC
jgi:hypothetical protein